MKRRITLLACALACMVMLTGCKVPAWLLGQLPPQVVIPLSGSARHAADFMQFAPKPTSEKAEGGDVLKRAD